MTSKLLPFGLLLLSSFHILAAQPDPVKLATFQKFVNGQVPIKEAVVGRELSTNGVVINKEWWRFAWQNDTSYVQRLQPDPTNATKFLPASPNICGASYTQLWTVSDQTLHYADKTTAKGSVPEEYGAFYRSLAFSALSLGIPKQFQGNQIACDPVEWNDAEFKTTLANQPNEKGIVTGSNTVSVKMNLGENGLPASFQFPATGARHAYTVIYEYTPDTTGVPSSVTVQYPARTLRYQILSLTLGTNDTLGTNGYEPAMFADLKLKRTVMLWTNEFPYEQRDGKSHPSFQPDPPKIGQPPPALQGTDWLLGATPVKLQELHGKVVLLDFWTVNCPQCITDLPTMETLHDKFQSQGLTVIGVTYGWGDEKKAARILKDKKITYANLIDAELAIADDKLGATMWNYTLDCSPSYALIDKSGNLAWKSTNGVNPTESQIRELLAR